MFDPLDRVRAIALTYPGVEESSTFATPALKVNGRMLAQMWRKDEDVLILSMPILERDIRIGAEPDIFFITDHFRAWPSVLIHMNQLDDAYLRDLIESAWRRRAQKAH